jgi:hypothetical protein
MTEEQELALERLPGDGPLDETDVSLRAYFTRMTDERLAQYDPSWPDERVIEWDGNFRSDGALMLTCCERDVDAEEYRQVLERHLAYRRSLAARPSRARSEAE